jgi:hypothetical protein
MKLDMLFVESRKNLESNSNVNITLPTNLLVFFLLYEILEDVRFVWQNMGMTFSFFSTSSVYDIMIYWQIS